MSVKVEGFEEGGGGQERLPSSQRRGRKPRHDAKSAQLNIRMEPSLKAAGDIVLEREGISPSEAVRLLYEYLVRKKQLPRELCESDAPDASDSWAHEHAGFATRAYEELTGTPFDSAAARGLALRDLREGRLGGERAVLSGASCEGDADA